MTIGSHGRNRYWELAKYELVRKTVGKMNLSKCAKEEY